jgi:hypothetical protein
VTVVAQTEYTDISTEAEFKTHSDALHHVIKLLTDGRTGVVTDPSDIQCVGHRVVHGGSRFKTAAVIDDAVLAAIEEACSLAPLHGPHNLLGIQVAKTMFPVPQVRRPNCSTTLAPTLTLPYLLTLWKRFSGCRGVLNVLGLTVMSGFGCVSISSHGLRACG